MLNKIFSKNQNKFNILYDIENNLYLFNLKNKPIYEKKLYINILKKEILIYYYLINNL